MATRSPCRLALIITELDVGGAERCLVNIALGLDRELFAPVVYALARRPTQSQLVERLDHAGIPVHFLGATAAWQAWSVQRELARRLRAEPPRLVQTFLFHANVLGGLAARQAGVRHIVWGVRVADPSRWRQFVERRTARHVDRVVCVSQSVASFLAARVALPPEKLAVIPNGVDLSAFPAEPTTDDHLPLKGTRRAIAVVARLHPQKGIDWLLRVLPTVLPDVPDVDVLVVGQGPQRDQLEQLSRRLGIEARVHFLGWRADVPGILARSELLVLPSRWEGMPNAVLEAMATGLPVVASRAEGVSELLGPDAEEHLVEFENSDALRGAIVQLLRDQAHARVVGQQNRRRAEQRFSLDAMLASYQRLYWELLDGKHR